MISALSNCASAYFILNKNVECIQSCNEILVKLKSVKLIPHDISTHCKIFCIPSYGSQNRTRMVLTTLCKRASAHAKMNHFQNAADDLREASKIAKGDGTNCWQTLINDVQHVETKLKNYLET